MSACVLSRGCSLLELWMHVVWVWRLRNISFQSAARNSFRPLYLPGLIPADLFVPEPVMCLGPGLRNFPPNDRSETTADHGGPHINMNNEAANGRQCCGYVHCYRQITQPAQAPRDIFHEPEPNPRDQQQNDSEKHQPEKQLLAVVESAHGRQFLVFVLDVVFHRLRPATVCLGDLHVAAPHRVHPHHGDSEGQPKPGMPESGSRSTAD